MFKVGIECESIEDQTWGVGGIVKNLLKEIAKRPELQKEFKFFLYFKSKIPNFDFLDNPIFVKKIISVPLLPSSFSLYYYLFLPIKLWFEKLDAIFFPNYMLPLIFCGKSLVMLTEDIYYEINSSALPFRYRLAYKIFANWSAKHATKIMAISETSGREISKLFKINPRRIAVNQLGVNVPKLENLSQVHQRIGNYILFVGQTFPRRHLKESLLAFEKTSLKFPDLKFVAIGVDKYNPPIIKRLSAEINHRLGKNAIIYKEYVGDKELAELYSGATLTLYVSSKEAFGLPPLEALAHGSVPIVTDNDLSREIYGNPPDEKAFFVSRPDSVESIVTAIEEGLANKEKREQIKNSAAEILEKYTWTNHADRFLEIIKNI